MKSKQLLLLGVLVLAFCQLAGFAQDNPPATTPAAAAPDVAVTTGAAAAVIPLIVIDDAPLTDAIRNLARQANLNYITDPKVPYGQPGPDGKPAPQPSISIRWENLTAEQALTALLNNYNLVLEEDPKTKIARISVRDPAAPLPLITKIIQLKYSNASNIVTAVQTTFIDRRSKVIPDIRTSQLVILATEPELAAVDNLVDKLDTPTRQVLIEAELLETSKNPVTKKGIDWSGTLDAQNFTFGNGTMSSGASSGGGAGGSGSTTTIPGTPTTVTLPGGRTVTTQPAYSAQTVVNTLLGSGGLSYNTLSGFTPGMAFLNADGVRAVLSFLNKDLDAKVLSTPRAVTLDNQEAILSVTRAHPIFATTAGTQGSPGGSQVTYTNLGTILKVTPRISANDYINLRVEPEVSSVLGTPAKRIVAGVVNEADIFDMRSIKTEVMIPSGNTLVLGGLVSDDSSKGYTKVPVLGDLPLLGLAFRYESNTRLKKNLLIFITPTIVTENDFQPKQTEFLKTPMLEEPETLESAWDSGKPMDWSKPVFPLKSAPVRP